MSTEYTPGPRRKRAEGPEGADDPVEEQEGVNTPPEPGEDGGTPSGETIDARGSGASPDPVEGSFSPPSVPEQDEPPLFGVDLPDLVVQEPDWKERFTRLSATYDNDRRRWRRQADEQFRRGQDGGVALVAGLIADLGRLCEHARADDAVAEYARGFDLVHQAALRLLADQGATCFAAVGDAFDPQRHEALTVLDRGLAPGLIVDVVSQGWERDGRVVLPARVVVQP